MTSQNLIYFMLAAYIIPIAFVYYKYNAQAQETGTRSISSIITSTETLYIIRTRYIECHRRPPHNLCIPNPSLYGVVYAVHDRIHRPL